MDKQEISKGLHAQYGQFCEVVQNLNPEAFIFNPEGKWSAAQQLDHMIRSVRPVVLGLSLPSFLLRLIFGRAKHASRDYDTLVKTYQDALAKGGKSPKAYEPKVTWRRLSKFWRREIDANDCGSGSFVGFPQ